MDALKRWRQPAAFVVLGALLAHLVLSVVGLFLLAAPGGYGSWSLAAASIGFLALDGAGLVVLALLVVACGSFEPTSHARFLTAAACVVAAASVLLGLVCAVVALVVGQGSPLINVLAVLASLVAPAVVTVGLGLFWRHQARAARAPVPISATEPEPAEPARPPSTEVARTAPVWAPDEASGAVWHTAGAAAAGSAASGWGSPEGAVGWNPVPGPAEPPAIDWTPAPAPGPRETGSYWAPPSGPRPPEH